MSPSLVARLEICSVSLDTMDSTAKAKGDVSNEAFKVENSSLSQRLFRDQMTDNGKGEFNITNILESSTVSLSMFLVIVTDIISVVYTIKPEE